MSNLIAVAALVLQFLVSALVILSPIFLDRFIEVDIAEISLCIFIPVSVGSFVGGFLADKIGRRLVLNITVALICIGSLSMLFNVYVGFAIAGLGIGPANNLSFVYIAQMYKNRQILSVFLLCGWASGEIILGAIFQYINTIQTFFIYFLIVPSSIVLALTIVTIEETKIYLNKQEDNRNEEFRIFPKNMKQLVLGSLIMFTIQMFYYRTQFTLDRFGISLPLNTIIVGCAELLANTTAAFVIPHIKRKKYLCLLFALLFGLFTLLNLYKQGILQSIVEGVMRVADCFVMAILGVYVPQLFPVEDRGRGVNFVMSFGVIGGGVAPIILQNLPWYGLIAFIVVAFIATLFLRETLEINQIQKIEGKSAAAEQCICFGQQKLLSRIS